MGWWQGLVMFSLIFFKGIQKHLPIGLEAGVGDFAFPFATDPFAIDLPSRDEGLFQFLKRECI